MEEENLSVSEVAQRLREMEDHNIALRLQEEEFMRHYDRNRQDRRLVGDDTKRSLREQADEDMQARLRRLEASRKIAESDEELARRLQREFEEEERRQLEEQTRRDAELAERLLEAEQNRTAASSSSVHLPPAEPTNPTTQLDGNLIDIDLVPELTNPTTSTTVTGGVYDSTAVLPSDSLSGSSGPALVESLHPTNPFLQDIAGPQVASQQPPPPYYYSEFGLPPPSDLALGKRGE
ncbi:hypothetical protein Q1695_013244 [Nippostrongylus brasiliensis]|nr:hypothetical protein Q1695_013244 [Nippostrongylus brasiliensis]